MVHTQKSSRLDKGLVRPPNESACEKENMTERLVRVDSSASCQLKLYQFPDPVFAFAMDLPDDFLSPQREHEAVYEIKRRLCLRIDVGDAAVFTLSKQQRAAVLKDLSEPTPARFATPSTHAVSRYGLAQLTLACTMGNPYGLKDQRDGAVVHDIFPRADLVDRANSSFGARQPFVFHTDQAYNANSLEVPDCFLLTCRRNEERAITRTSSVDEALEYLTPNQIDVLLGDNFLFYRGRITENFHSRIGSVLSRVDDDYQLRIGTDMEGRTPAAGSALTAFQHALNRVAKDHALLNGETLVVPNRTYAHARTGFEPHQDVSRRRWLQRIFVTY